MRCLKGVMLAAMVMVAVVSCASRQETPSNVDGEPDQSASSARMQSPDWSRVQSLILASAEAISTMRAESEVFDAVVEDAAAVLIFPEYLRVAYLGSVGGARGLLMVRDRAGFWTGPAFFRLGEVGGGFQAGVEYGAMAYVIHDPSMVPEVAKARWQFDAEVAAVVLATDERHQVTELTEDNKASLFTDMDGLFAGAAFDGGYVNEWEAANAAFHGQFGLTGEDILLHGKGRKDGAELVTDALYAPALH